MEKALHLQSLFCALNVFFSDGIENNYVYKKSDKKFYFTVAEVK